MHVSIKQVEGISFVAKGDTNHWVSIDGPERFNGSNAGCRPKELLLISLGSCTGSDVVSILHKKRIDLKKIDIEVDATVAEKHPKVFSYIKIFYHFYGEDLAVKENDIKRAIDLSQDKYCPISAMLKKSCPIEYTYEIH